MSAAYLPPKYKLVEKSNINDDQHLLVFSPYLNKIQASAIPGGGPSITVVTVLDQTPTWPPSAVNAGTFRGGKTLLAYSPDAETSVLTWTERPGLVVRVIGVNGPDALVLRRVAEALRISD